MNEQLPYAEIAKAMSSPGLLQLLYIADDNGESDNLLRSFAKEFARGTCMIRRAVALEEALVLLRAGPYDAVLLDLGLNETAMLTMLNAIKEVNPDLAVVILSAHHDLAAALQAVQSGAQEYVVKTHGDSRLLALSVLSSIERKRYERHLFRLANYDALTGLPNRRMFQEYIRHWLVRADRWRRTEAIMFMDVNDFKSVNDNLGHDAGDALLIEIAMRLKSGLRASDMLARFGGDEFVVHLDMGAAIDRETCCKMAEKIASLFVDPIMVGGRPIHTGISIGIALYPDHGGNSGELIQKADEAMYIAKRHRLAYAFADNAVTPEPSLL